MNNSQWHPLNSAHPEATLTTPYYCELGAGLVKVSGADAAQFLQNLLTNDVMQLTNGQCQLNGFCNPKGRLLASFLLIRQQDEYLLLLPEDQASFITQRLSMFKLRSKVTVEDCSQQYQTTYLRADSTGTGIPLPWQNNSSLMLSETAQHAAQLKELEADNWLNAGTEQFSVDLLQQGVPVVYAATREQFTPQQINFEVMGGVSFKKGCYPGQEVVARLHYLGKPSRRMFLCRLNNTSANLNAGDEVVDANQEVLGHIVNHAKQADGDVLLVSFKLSAIGQSVFTADGEVISDIWSLIADDEA
ncbi:folate-dependent protein for Fe/S cluster synthesis/repair in oxidative stress [Methylophaga lonarensis MPL]|uniref:Folate-dependent protein for Fe/S cluster synthesis/repair in oxidative stress n=1 Tax=Methylophaga lonarensis MPL TaxID=1286106 RepID=M7PI04_9GAMM|nr:folate-binding protein YgfZ [Methylophaga lonarensis]EMR13530.1 folate-dependent protein for Fe/S cluster synthesis/repair in oxidative stress [Methylophaga lonarensis MPL]